jgi:phosphatidate cytidylyltransferase
MPTASAVLGARVNKWSSKRVLEALKARLISAAIMVPLVVCGVLFLSTPVFSLILAAILCAAAWEWSHLIPVENTVLRVIYVLAIAALMWVLWQAGLAQSIYPLLLLAFIWWLCALFWLSRPQLGAAVSPLHVNLKLIAGGLVIVPAWAALITLHSSSERGPELTLMLLVMVWLADSGAYFAGRQWGKTRLAPAVSPGKTWEGVYGGVLASVVFAGVAGGLYSRSLKWTLMFMLVASITVMFSVAGDLLESLMKRHSGIKDSGHIIPGHGGIFDRIDGLVAAAPMFLIGFLWLDL